MRKIEQAMLTALTLGRVWHGANTSVSADGTVYLHGNRIAYRVDGSLVADEATLRSWPTNTTRSRLRALGFKVQRDRIIGRA